DIEKDGNEYTKEVMIEGQKVRVIRKKSNSNMCIFWDDNNKKCSIYNNRPFDCVMYPFDIYLINGRYHWVIYSCNPESGWQWTEEHMKMLENHPQFIEIISNIEAYSNLHEINNLTKLDQLSYTILREVNFKKILKQI
ncbi:MAG TPA: YkgJ family cysteine cluster protein, partial [Candidatus Bathyarchaeia archaeon]|nr:YkgJ family cysteine cluster protein [Candidatus Bathyarchaeia archaeon]